AGQGITRCVTPASAARWSNGPSYSSPTSSAPGTVRTSLASGLRDTAHHSPSSVRPYSASGLTAAATLAGSVHGVVVQTTNDSPSRSLSGKRTNSDGCSSSLYSPAKSSCWEIEVPQRGHQ